MLKDSISADGGYRFSAFWLRSSVVSVLISLISDTSSIRGPYIKLHFGTWRQNRGLLRLLHASTWYCSVSRNGAFLFGKTCFVKRNAYFVDMSLILNNFRDVSDILMSSFVSVLCILFSVPRYVVCPRCLFVLFLKPDL